MCIKKLYIKYIYMDYYQKYLKYKNKYLIIQKQYGGATLIELVRTNSNFRIWCSTLNNQKKSYEVKLGEFAEFKDLLDENEKQKVIDYIIKGGVHPDWLKLALSSSGEQLLNIQQAERRIKEAFVYTLRLYPNHAKNIFTELKKGKSIRVEYWVSEKLASKTDVLDEVIGLIDSQGINQATDIIHRLIPEYMGFIKYLPRYEQTAAMPLDPTSGRAAMPLDPTSGRAAMPLDPTSGRAAMASSVKVSFSELLGQKPDFLRLLQIYRDSATNPKVRFDTLNELEKYKNFLTPDGAKELDKFFEKGESIKVPTHAQVMSTILRLSRDLPEKYCPDCKKMCPQGIKCPETNLYH